MAWAFLLTVGAALFPAQDPPRITLEKKGRLSELASELRPLLGPFEIDPKVEDRELTLSVREAGYFEVLDALCRSHGDLRYYTWGLKWRTDGRPIPLRAGKPVAYVTAYEGHFKFHVTQVTRVRSRSVDGEGAWNHVEVALLGPPFEKVGWESGASAKWKLTAARDRDGRDVLPARGESRRVLDDGEFEGNVAMWSFALADFNLDQGLALLRGEALVRSPECKEVQVRLEAGKELEVPGGVLVVDRVEEPQPLRWRFALTLKPVDPQRTLKKALDGVVHFEHGTRWVPITLPSKGLSFELDAPAPVQPGWVKLQFRTGERKVVVPFEFRDVRFGE